MDYLNPKKQFQQRILLFTGYICMAIAITIATLVLVYQAYGFGLDRNGDVIQNGIVFFSSHPNPADIYVDGKLNRARTNSRVILPSALYDIDIKRTGYRDWKHQIDVTGGSVLHYDYPLLIPQTLTTTPVVNLTALPATALQSPDRRWIAAPSQQNGTDFSLFDIKAPRQVTSTTLSVPSSLFTSGVSGSNVITEWSDDNRHFLMKHTVGTSIEYILVDRTDPAASINLSRTLQTTITDIRLADRKYDQYFLYDPSSHVLSKANLRAPVVTPVLTHVLAFKTYGTNEILYATDADTPASKTAIRLLDGTKTYDIRTFDAGTTYLLDLTTYSGDLYVIAGATSESKVYIYHDPVGQLQANPRHVVVPQQVLHVVNPGYVSFSANAQFVMAEGGSQFGVYDIENAKGYNFISSLPLDAPQQHATWADSDHLTFVSGGKSVIFDYDHTNVQLLSPAAAALGTFFGPDYNYFYDFSPASGTTPPALVQTSLLIPADQ